MTVNEIEKSISICGLVCALCSHNSNCAGCRTKDEDCSEKKRQCDDNCTIKKCCLGKNLEYCYLCDEFPCAEGMFKNTRIKAFNLFAKEHGLHSLAEGLMRNYKDGIRYHRNDGLKGDYDRLLTEHEMISLLMNSRPAPYDNCPIYDSESFLLRLVSAEDAKNLLICYSSSAAQRFFNTDNCSFGYGEADTLEKMQYIIKLWLDSYRSRGFVRFSIIDKATNTVIGTVEMFGGQYGILRADVLPDYEYENYLSELFALTELFFIDFKCNTILTKAIPEATERMNALKKCGYMPYPRSEVWSREHYYVKVQKR